MKNAPFIAILAVAALSGCGGVRNMQTVKSENYGTAPRNIVAILNEADPSFPAFKESLAKEMAACGIHLEFVQVAPGQTTINAPWAQAILQFRQLGHETTTVTQYGRPVDNYTSMYRYELMLTDMTEKKVVWKGQGDFRTAENSHDPLKRAITESPAYGWTTDIMAQMKKDGLIGTCDPSLLPQATSATTRTDASTIPVSAPVGKLTFQVGGKTYDSLDAAEASMRADAATAVEQIAPSSTPPRSSLLIVVPVLKQGKITQIGGLDPSQVEQLMAYSQKVTAVGHDTTADAIRKSNLFHQVTLIREDNVQDSDFRGAGYKLWIAGKEWKLAKQGSNGSQVVTTPPSGQIKVAALKKTLDSIETGLNQLDTN